MDRIKNNKFIMMAMALAMALGLIIAPLRGTNTDIYANAPVSVTVDGHLVLFPDQRPIMVENRVMVPVRGVFEMMGFEVTWDNTMRMARLERSDVLIIIPADLNSFVVNSTIVSPSVPQQLTNNRLMLPLRYVAEAAFGSAEWDPVNRVAIITTNRPQATPSPTPPPATPPPTPYPTPTPEPEQTPTPTPYSSPTPTPEPDPTPTPEPTPPPPPRPLFGIRAFEDNPRHNLIRGANVNIQGTMHSGNIVTRDGRAATGNRYSDSWIDFNVADFDFTRLTGYVGRTGAAAHVPDAAHRRVTIYGDGHVLRYFDVGGDFPATAFDADISGVTTIRVHFQAIGPAYQNGVSLAAFNLYVQ
ncbi:MAG: stalk domain-containing protein [Defluviitaleaceae bacterium]|nr:stalk domain-containing protein [Defluviitaleaceae bacterium]